MENISNSTFYNVCINTCTLKKELQSLLRSDVYESQNTNCADGKLIYEYQKSNKDFESSYSFESVIFTFFIIFFFMIIAFICDYINKKRYYNLSTD